MGHYQKNQEHTEEQEKPVMISPSKQISDFGSPEKTQQNIQGPNLSANIKSEVFVI